MKGGEISSYILGFSDILFVEESCCDPNQRKASLSILERGNDA
jgi:hypothetical protein